MGARALRACQSETVMVGRAGASAARERLQIGFVRAQASKRTRKMGARALRACLSFRVRLPRHVYIHVPFCARRCVYCDFAIAVRRRVPVDEYVAAIDRELTLR